jgi:aminoglycoside 3-N-acetyltransferase
VRALAREKIAAALSDLGLRTGDVVFVHGSMRSMGYVAGGADAVVDAFLDTLGPEGTIVVPTFIFSHSADGVAVFDPERDPSEMGRLTETVRTRAGADRSCHLVHSVAALGPHAKQITAVQGAAAWAADGPFWQLYVLGARILLLGVPYLRCTYFHVIEQLVQVSYRRWKKREAMIRESNGTMRDLPTVGYGPERDFRGNDFNKLGALLEDRGLAHVGAVGNAVARLFPARGALEVGVAEYRKDPQLFVKTGETVTPLRDGVMTEDLNNEKCVFDPAVMFLPPP